MEAGFGNNNVDVANLAEKVGLRLPNQNQASFFLKCGDVLWLSSAAVANVSLGAALSRGKRLGVGAGVGKGAGKREGERGILFFGVDFILLYQKYA